MFTSEVATEETICEKEEELLKTKLKDAPPDNVFYLYSYIDLLSPIGSRLHIEAFKTEEDALQRDKDLEFKENKLKIIEDRRVQAVTFTGGWDQFILFRKGLLKKAKKADKKTKKKLDKLLQHDRAIRADSLLPIPPDATQAQ